jgi:hypothetical protein
MVKTPSSVGVPIKLDRDCERKRGNLHHGRALDESAGGV